MRFFAKIRPPTGKLAGRLGYTGFALLAFAISLYWTFPGQVVSARLEQEVAKASGGQLRLKVARAQLWRLSGLHAENVTVRLGQQAPILLDSVRLRLRLLPLLLWRLSAYGQVQLEGGTLDVILTRRGKENLDLHAELDAINLAKPEAIGKMVGMPMTGSLSGEITLDGAQDLSHSRGKIELKVGHLALGPGDIRGLSVPELPLGELALEAEVTDGTLQVKKLRQQGGKLTLAGGGKLLLSRTFAASGLDVCFRLGADAGFLAENPKLSTLFQLAQTQLKRDADGQLNLPLQGVVAAPEVRPTLCPRR